MPTSILNNESFLLTGKLLDLLKNLNEVGVEFFERLSSFNSQFTGAESPEYIKEKILEFFSSNTGLLLTLTELQSYVNTEKKIHLNLWMI